MGCYGYNLVTHIGSLSLNGLKKGQITQNLKLFIVLEFASLVILVLIVTVPGHCWSSLLLC